MRQEGIQFNNNLERIEDACNQLYCFHSFENLDKIKELIKQEDLQNLEVYTKKTREELEKAKPGVVDKYNALVVKLRESNFTFEEFKELMKEVWRVTH